MLHVSFCPQTFSLFFIKITILPQNIRDLHNILCVAVSSQLVPLVKADALLGPPSTESHINMATEA